MVVTRVFSVFVLAVSMLSFAAKAQAADTPLTELDPEIAKRFGEMIHTQFAKENKDAKPKFEMNFEKASGLFNAESNEGIIVIPAKNFKEDRENKEVEKDPGVGMCFLCMSQTYNPLIDGKPVDGKKAFQIKFDDGQGGADALPPACCARFVTSKAMTGSSTFGAKTKSRSSRPIGVKPATLPSRTWP